MIIYKYLGILIDFKLNLNEHLQRLKRTTQTLVYRFKRLGKKNWPMKTWIILFKMYIMPHFIYSSTAYEAIKEKNKTSHLRFNTLVRTTFKNFMGIKRSFPNESFNILC